MEPGGRGDATGWDEHTRASPSARDEIHAEKMIVEPTRMVLKRHFAPPLLPIEFMVIDR